MDQLELRDNIASCAKNDRHAQKLLYQHYFSIAMNIALRYSSNYDNAVEMVNDGFLKIFNDLKNFTPVSQNILLSFHGWLKRIMINACIDHIRKYRKKELMVSVALDYEQENNFIEEMNNQFLYKDIIACIQKLPPAYKMVFNLFVIEGYSHKEIASFMDITEGTSKSNLFKAREYLRNLLQKINIENGYQQSI